MAVGLACGMMAWQGAAAQGVDEQDAGARGGKAATVWHDPLEGEVPAVGGRGWNAETGRNFNRLPPRAKDMVRPEVWNLSLYSSGLYIDFRTNSPTIRIRYTLAPEMRLANVPRFTTGGIDLYRYDSNDNEHWLNGFPRFDFSRAANDSVFWNFRNIRPEDPVEGDRYRIFLPTYGVIGAMSIGVEEGSTFSFLPESEEKPIVVYGTSIAMGASPSRPANAWTALLQRMSGIPVVNLGFSGNGRLEKGMFDLLSELDVRVYILDCLPNMGAYVDSIVTRTVAGVEKLRSRNDAPIILVGNVGCAYDDTGTLAATNDAQLEAFETLKEAGVKDIYYVTTEDLGLAEDDYADGAHPNDIGMMKYAEAYMRVLRKIL